MASQSPRRAELLSLLGIDFSIVALDVEEDYSTELKGEKITEFLAQKKADAYQNLKKNQIILTADTLVMTSDQVLSKPQDTKEAKGMLQTLSGKEHRVVTSFCIKTTTKKVVCSDEAKLFFKKLSDKEIDFYVDNFSVLDKAGAYGVQDWIGAIGIDRIDGSFYTIMGLPTHLVYRELMKF